MKYKVIELEGALLDAAVAIIEGHATPDHFRPHFGPDQQPVEPPIFKHLPRYSREWTHGGPIIERERIGIYTDSTDKTAPWFAGYAAITGQCSGAPTEYEGRTPLIAAMRAYVASKLGEEIELP